MTTATADTLHLSRLAPTTIQSEIRAMSVACDAGGGVNLAQGIGDTETPEVVQGANAAEKARDLLARTA